MQKAKEKVQKLESMIRSYVNKVDEKNEYLIEKQNIYNEISEHVKTTRSDIKYEIQNIPNKKKRAKSDIDRRLKESKIIWNIRRQAYCYTRVRECWI